MIRATESRWINTHVPNPIEDTSVPPRLPVNPTAIQHTIRPPVVGVPEVGVPYVEPVDVVPPPLFRRPPIASVPVGVSVAGAVDEGGVPVPRRHMSGIIHANDTHVFTRVPNPIEDTSVPPRLPVNPAVIHRPCRPPVVGVPEVGVPYVEPVDVVPPPMFRMPMLASVPIGVSVAGAVEDPLAGGVGVGVGATNGNNGVFPCITYGGVNPIYAPFGVIAGLSGDISNISNEITNISNELIVINSNITTLSTELTNLSAYVYTLQNDTSQWSTYPAVSAVDLNNNSITNISSLQIDAQILTADASDLFLNGIAVATVTDISNVADWSLFPAISDVQMNTHNIVSEISGQGQFGIASWNSLEIIGGL